METRYSCSDKLLRPNVQSIKKIYEARMQRTIEWNIVKHEEY